MPSTTRKHSISDQKLLMFNKGAILGFKHKNIPDVECTGEIEGVSGNKVKFSWINPQACHAAWISDMSDIKILSRNSNRGGKSRRTRRRKQSKRR